MVHTNAILFQFWGHKTEIKLLFTRNISLTFYLFTREQSCMLEKVSVVWYFLCSDHRRGNVHLCIRFIFNCSVKLCSLIHNESWRLFSCCFTASEMCLIIHTHIAKKWARRTQTPDNVHDSSLITQYPGDWKTARLTNYWSFFRSITNQLLIGIIRPKRITWLVKLANQLFPRASDTVCEKLPSQDL